MTPQEKKEYITLQVMKPEEKRSYNEIRADLELAILKMKLQGKNVLKPQ